MRYLRSKIQDVYQIQTIFIKYCDIILALIKSRRLFQLHLKINKVLRNQRKNWPHFVYGYGYHYQGWDLINITGRRETNLRFNNYNIVDFLSKKHNALDIGSNTGFFSIKLAKYVKHIDCIEWNPYLNQIGKIVTDYLEVINVNFINSDIFSYNFNKKYDLIFSMASHNTDDKGNSNNLNEYFDKIYNLISKEGILFFESHPDEIFNTKFIDFIENNDQFKLIRRIIHSDRPLKEKEDRFFLIFASC